MTGKQTFAAIGQELAAFEPNANALTPDLVKARIQQLLQTEADFKTSISFIKNLLTELKLMPKPGEDFNMKKVINTLLPAILGGNLNFENIQIEPLITIIKKYNDQ